MISNYVNMISKYSDLILREASNSWNNIDFSKPEPEIIKEYLLSAGKGVDYLNHNVSKIITNQTEYELKFASVFCHQKPRVVRTFNSRKNCIGSTDSCELGDLMIVFLLLDKNKNVVCSTAKIMQAKKQDNLDSESQKCLYESDLDFNMPNNVVKVSSNDFALRKLPNYSERRNMGLSYLILNGGNPYNKEIPSASNLHYGWNYHLELMMELKTGKKFVNPIDKEDIGWNCIISDLLNIGTGKVKSSIDRGYGLDFFINAFNYYYYYPEYKIENEETGIPKIIIICKNTERSID